MAADEPGVEVGDTVTDILEGKHAGVKTAGIVVGSSVMGLSRKSMTA